MTAAWRRAGVGAIASVCLLAAVQRPAGAMELLAVGAEGPAGVAVGARVDGRAVFEVGSGGRLTLLCSTGRTITIFGPRRATLDGTACAGNGGAREARLPEWSAFLLDNIAHFLRGQGFGDIGGVRAPSAAPPPGTDLMVLDLTARGSHCAVGGEPLMVWMPGVRSQFLARFRRTADDRRASISWPAGVSVLPWPDRVPLVDRAAYEVEARGVLPLRTFVLHLAPARPDSLPVMAEWLLREGCPAQLRRMLEGLPQEVVGPPPAAQ